MSIISFNLFFSRCSTINLITFSLNGKKFPIYGNGEQKSEYIYVEDVVEAFIRSMNSEKDLGGKVIHVGSGQSNSVNEIVHACEKAWNKKIEVEYNLQTI